VDSLPAAWFRRSGSNHRGLTAKTTAKPTSINVHPGFEDRGAAVPRRVNLAVIAAKIRANWRGWMRLSRPLGVKASRTRLRSMQARLVCSPPI